MKPKEIKDVSKSLRETRKTYNEIGNILNVTRHAARGLCVNKARSHPKKTGKKELLQKKTN